MLRRFRLLLPFLAYYLYWYGGTRRDYYRDDGLVDVQRKVWVSGGFYYWQYQYTTVPPPFTSMPYVNPYYPPY
jgi:hypothetical protein